MKNDDINLIVFGGNNKNFYSKIPFKIHNFYEINNDEILQKLYSAADVMVAPSKMETFGLAAQESISCGTPVVAFNNTGLAEIIEHKVTGYLAEFLNEKELAEELNGH